MLTASIKSPSPILLPVVAYPILDSTVVTNIESALVLKYDRGRYISVPSLRTGITPAASTGTMVNGTVPMLARSDISTWDITKS